VAIDKGDGPFNPDPNIEGMLIQVQFDGLCMTQCHQVLKDGFKKVAVQVRMASLLMGSSVSMLCDACNDNATLTYRDTLDKVS